MNGFPILVVIFYPITTLSVGRFLGLSKFSALASGFIVALVLWLYALPRDLAWTFLIDIAPRFAMPLTAYLVGLVVAAILMHWATEQRPLK